MFPSLIRIQLPSPSTTLLHTSNDEVSMNHDDDHKHGSVLVMDDAPPPLLLSPSKSSLHTTMTSSSSLLDESESSAASHNSNSSVVSVHSSNCSVMSENHNYDLLEDPPPPPPSCCIVPPPPSLSLSLSSSFLKVKAWDRTSGYSDYIRDGLHYLHHHGRGSGGDNNRSKEEEEEEEEAMNPADKREDNHHVMNATTTNRHTKTHHKVIMLYESPSSSNAESTFFNRDVYKFHDRPAPGASSSYKAKTLLGPCRYALMNGASFPVFLSSSTSSNDRGTAKASATAAATLPEGLIEHWQATLPNFVRPSFVSMSDDPTTDDDVDAPTSTEEDLMHTALWYAYLPCERIRHHVNDPHVHYHLAGKDALARMTASHQTPQLRASTSCAHRPCIAKTTHSMGSKGIFVIRNDDDEHDFQQFLHSSGHPTFVVTELIDIDRNVACHFFIHPSGEITFFGSNENFRKPPRRPTAHADAAAADIIVGHKEEEESLLQEGEFSLDSYLIQADQASLREMQMPFVQDVVAYCLSLGFWGFCGIDVLFGKNNHHNHNNSQLPNTTPQGYLVDVNPRVTGSCPALMVGTLLHDQCPDVYKVGLFRRSGDIYYYGPTETLFQQVHTHNYHHHHNRNNHTTNTHTRVVIFSCVELFDEESTTTGSSAAAAVYTKVNIGVYGPSIDKCQAVLNRFAQPKKGR